MEYYPVGIKLRGKRTLVVGAGRIAERKVKTLLAYGARIKVVAPEATRHIRTASRDGRIALMQRCYTASDIQGAALVIAATSDRVVNRRVGADARKRGILVNVVDDTAACEFISTAIIKRRGIVISISTDGKEPKLSREFKDFLKRKLDEVTLNRNKP